MKSKQEVIQEAYGQYWPEVEKDIVQECYICLINERSTLVAWNDLLMIAHKTDNHLYMPASLKGIETNNGWTRIDSEEDLPTSGMKNYMYCVDGKPSVFVVNLCVLLSLSKDGMVSHYMALPSPQAPIY